MKREEAIQWLTDIKENITENWSHDVAIDMAIEALSVANLKEEFESVDAEFTDLPDIPRYYYEKVVGKMAHEINMLKEQLESADAVQGEWIVREYCTNELDYRRWIEIECPFCGEKPTYEDLDNMNYCPNCGARMKGGEDE